MAQWQQFMSQNDHVVSIDEDSKVIIQLVEDFVAEAMNQNGYCALQHQLKLYQT